MLVRVIAAISMLLFAAALADWINSLFHSETLILVRGQTVYAIDNFDGELAFWRGELTPGYRFPDGLYYEHWQAKSAKKTLQFSIDNNTGSEWALLGFVLTTQRHFPTTGDTFIPQRVHRHACAAVPLWFVTLVLAGVAVPAVTRVRRERRRAREGHCEVCGYDLRATHDRCPECGTPLVTSPSRQVAS